jgi:hypothetical protein
MLELSKTFSIKKTTFDIGAAISTSWPQLWYVTCKRGHKSWLPLAIKVTQERDGKGTLVFLIIGPLGLHVGWM